MNNEILFSQTFTLSDDGTSEVANVSARDFQNIALMAIGTEDAVFSVRVKGSLQIDPPDFTVPAGIDNHWSYIQLKDDESDGYLDGTTGYVFDADAVASIELNTSVLTWVAVEVFNYSGGLFTGKFVFKNNA